MSFNTEAPIMTSDVSSMSSNEDEVSTLQSSQVIVVPMFPVGNQACEDFVNACRRAEYKVTSVTKIWQLSVAVYANKPAIVQVPVELANFLANREAELLPMLPNYCTDLPFARASTPFATILTRSQLPLVHYDELMRKLSSMHKGHTSSVPKDTPLTVKTISTENQHDVTNPLAKLGQPTMDTPDKPDELEGDA